MNKRIGVLILAALLCLIMPLAALAEGEGGSEPTPEPSDAVEISPAGDSDTYKEWLMDSFDQTLLGKDENIRRQLLNVLRSEEITVTADNYQNIIRYVDDTIKEQQLSEDAALDYYTEEDFEIAAGLIEKICTELGLEYSIDPSNDSQNEYARVITIKKDGKVLGRINSDAKTDIANKPPLAWVIGGGVLIAAATAFAIMLVVHVERKKKKAA